MSASRWCTAVAAASSTTQSTQSDDSTTTESATAAVSYSSVVTNVLAGLTVSLAMIPESLAFTFVAGVAPQVGLAAAATMAGVCALLGAQPGVISGAAGATAVVIAPLVASHGVEYLFACIALTGVVQMIAGQLRLGKFIRLVPQPVMMGFVNGLALVIGSAQLQAFKGIGSEALFPMIGLVALTMALIYAVPRYVTKKLPAPLVAIVAVTTFVRTAAIDTKTIGDIASVAGTLPTLHFPQVPLSFDMLATIAPYAVSVAAVGLIETLLTQQLVDSITERRTETHTECIAQGVANVATGFLGGMGGCAMIGQSMINVNAGGRTRVSGLTCAACLLGFIVIGSALIEAVPLAALVGTMWMLVLDIWDKSTFTRIGKVPKTDIVVVATVTAVTVATNLAVAVFCGVIIASLSYSWKSAQRIFVQRQVEEKAYNGNSAAVYVFTGPLFFGSTTLFGELVDPRSEEESVVVLDFLDSRIWDGSGLEAINEVVAKLETCGKEVHIRHLSPDCRGLLDRAGDLVEVNVLEDPEYGVAVDYDRSILSGLGGGLLNVNRTDEERMQAAIKRQYTVGGEKIYVKRT